MTWIVVIALAVVLMLSGTGIAYVVVSFARFMAAPVHVMGATRFGLPRLRNDDRTSVPAVPLSLAPLQLLNAFA